MALIVTVKVVGGECDTKGGGFREKMESGISLFPVALIHIGTSVEHTYNSRSHISLSLSLSLNLFTLKGLLVFYILNLYLSHNVDGNF